MAAAVAATATATATATSTNEGRDLMNHPASRLALFDQPIGQDFAYSIQLDDLVMRSTAYKPSSNSSNSSTSSSTEVDESNTAITSIDLKPPKRRVTFNLDNIQIQTIPNYYDDLASLNDSDIKPAVIEEEEECDYEEDDMKADSLTTLADNERISKKESFDALMTRKQIRRQHVAESTPTDSTSTSSNHDNYWFPPLPPIAGSVEKETDDSNTIFHKLPSLEAMERIIEETIERETALGPSLSEEDNNGNSTVVLETQIIALDNNKDLKKEEQQLVSNEPLPPPLLVLSEDEEEEEQQLVNNDINDELLPPLPPPRLILSEDEDEEEVYYPSAAVASSSSTATFTPITKEQDHSNSLTTTDASFLPKQYSSAAVENRPTTSQSPSTEVYGMDFSKSIYNELAKRHNQDPIPIQEFQPPHLTFPFEQDLVPISANPDIVYFIPPKKDQIWVDLVIPSASNSLPPLKEKTSLFFVKVLEAQSLDFPIDQDAFIYCNITTLHGVQVESTRQSMKHTMNFEQGAELLLSTTDIDFFNPITITLHVDTNSKKKSMNSISNNSGQNWLLRRSSSIRSFTSDISSRSLSSLSSSSTTDLNRYTHTVNGSICQTVFTPSQFIINSAANINAAATKKANVINQRASLMLVNNWYKSMHSAPSLRRTTSLLKKKRSSASLIVHEKAVGKLNIQCLYVEVYNGKEIVLPKTVNEVIEGLHIKKFHSTVWQSGYLSQLGGNTKYFKRRYFTLKGGDLLAYLERPTEQQDKQPQQPIYKIPLVRATRLVCDQRILAERSSYSRNRTAEPTWELLNQLDQIHNTTTHSDIMLPVEQDYYYSKRHPSVISLEDGDDEDEEEDGTYNFTDKNGFQIVFDNHEKIRFVCESLEERYKWMAVLEVMICKLPKLPDWVIAE